MNSSSEYIRSAHLISKDEENVQILAKEILQDRVFIGSFQEKRFVASLQSYRDVVVVCKDETDLLHDLDKVKKQICNLYSPERWIGITDPNTVGAPAGYCLWVELPEHIFGSYWYQIKRVRFKTNEVLIKLKAIRPVDSSVVNLNPSSVQINNSFTKEKLLNVATENVAWLLTDVVTLQNIKTAIMFLSVLLVASATGFINLLQYLGDFTLKLMREFSNLVRALTPSVIAFFNLCAKIVGGFYLLILSMWKTRSTPTYQQRYQSPYVSYSGGYPIHESVYFKRGLPAPPRERSGGVIITPLD
ncbi:hypothetical protein FQR65_LT05560 [Abscondita terminalis]|nr:hypothetical protein FQR65_LT05560 [Abscondita terminalis]